ncbi:unnamed protein product, partial [Closterium sp. NIES-65]
YWCDSGAAGVLSLGADSGGAVRGGGGAEPGGTTAGGAGPEGATAGGCGAWGWELLSLEVLLELELELLRPSRVRVLPVPELLDLRVRLELELLRAFVLRPAAVGPAAGGVGGAGAVAEGAGAVPAESRAAARPRPYFVPLLQQVLGRTLFALPVLLSRVLLATVVTDPSFESTAASALVAELVDFAARCRLDYAAGLVAESASVCPPSVGGECALGTDVLEDRPGGVTVVKRPPGSPPVFKARYVARGFSQRQGVDYFQTFSPTPKMTTLRVLLHIAAQRDYELHSLDFSTAFLQGSLHEEIWLRRPPGFTGTFPPGTQWSLRRPVYGLRQAPP